MTDGRSECRILLKVLAASRCFDRVTGAPVPQETLKTYRQALAQYHLHPETKFTNGDYLDAGRTERRHIEVVSIDRIGKEANRWEEQLYLGNDPEAQIVYGNDECDRKRTIAFIRDVANRVGRRALAEAAGVSVRETAAILRGERQPTTRTLGWLARAAAYLVGRAQAGGPGAVLSGERAGVRGTGRASATPKEPDER